MRDSNKPAVGHNLSYDLTFCLASFAQALPPSWDAYKQLVQRWFPAGVWDTKHLARQLQVRKAQRACCLMGTKGRSLNGHKGQVTDRNRG